MWEHRNGIKHSDESAANKAEHIYLNEKIREETQVGTDEVAHADKAHFELPEGYEDDWNIDGKRQWLEQVDTTRTHFHLVRHAALAAREKQKENMERWCNWRPSGSRSEES